MTRVGLLICAFVAGAVVAIWLLQDVLERVDLVNQDAAVLIDNVQMAASAASSIEAAGPDQLPDAATVQELRQAVERLAAHPATKPGGVGAAAFDRVRALAPAISAGPGVPHETSASFQVAITELAQALRSHVSTEQAAMGRYFRAMVVALTLAALVMVNVAIFVLLKITQMVLRPVSALVEGSRELAAEHFDHRVVIDQRDEFGELAHAYNRLAEQLGANEEHKTETLRQLAVTLNHDLNNAMAIIELQMGLLDRQATGNPTLSRHLREIRGVLARMSGTISSLKHIRRIVLVDYAPGQKMLDLARSVSDDAPLRPQPPAAAAS